MLSGVIVASVVLDAFRLFRSQVLTAATQQPNTPSEYSTSTKCTLARANVIQCADVLQVQLSMTQRGKERPALRQLAAFQNHVVSRLSVLFARLAERLASTGITLVSNRNSNNLQRTTASGFLHRP